MLSRFPLFFAAFVLALASTACSSLTRPDEITIVAEPPAPPVVKQLPQRPAAQPRPAAPDPAGGGG